MFMYRKSNNCFRVLIETNKRKFARSISPSLLVKPTQRYGFYHTNRNVGIRNISTSNNFWANISFNLTDIGEGIREVVVKEWYVKVGDQVSQFDNICEVQSDKAAVTITSRYDGIIRKLHYNTDDTAYVGQPLVDIETESTEDAKNDSQEKSTSKNETPHIQQTSPKDYKKTLCIPSVRRIAKEHNVDLSKVKGTGKDGRILKEDVLNVLQPLPSKDEVIIADDVSIQAIKSERTERITGFKKVMVKTMTDALKIPHFTYCDEVSVTKLNQLRSSIKNEAENAGVKLTLVPFFMKAISNALHEYPILNSSVDSNCENIIYHSAHNIGVAMDTPMGLAVPVVKNVDKLSLIEIAKELNRLMASGKLGGFTPSDLTEGTFTVSNIGAIGGTYVAPLVLSPQVSIIGLGIARLLPRFDSSNNVIQEQIINVSASADHRIVDGATMARFVNVVKKHIENPYLLFLHI